MKTFYSTLIAVLFFFSLPIKGSNKNYTGFTAPTPVITGPDTVCSGSSVTLNAGAGYTSYSWSPGGMTTQIITVSPGTTTTYTVTVTDASGTGSTTYTVKVFPGPAIAITTYPAICTSNNGTAIAQPAAGSHFASVTWSNGQHTTTITGLPPGSYTVTVTDIHGCTNHVSDSVQHAQISLTGHVIVSPPNCKSPTGSALIDSINGTSPYTYHWSPSGGSDSLATGLAPGAYTVSLKDANGCVGTQTATISAAVPAVVHVSPDTTISKGGTASLWAVGCATYSWTPSTGLSCAACPNPKATPLESTHYCVTGVDSNGCKATACTEVNLEKSCDVFIPNAFSPGRGGVNEMECVMSNCIESMSFMIYDRWGELVFQSNEPTACWDGKYKGELLNAAVFVYFADVTLKDGTHIKKKGNLSLIR